MYMYVICQVKKAETLVANSQCLNLFAFEAWFGVIVNSVQKVIEYDQEIPQAHTADQPTKLFPKHYCD